MPFHRPFLGLHRLGDLNLQEVDLKLWGLSGYQEISRLSVFYLDLDFPEEKAAALTADQADQVLGKRIIFSVDRPFRSFAGLVSRFLLGEISDEGRRTCRMEVVPELWKLTQIFNSRKYPPNKTVMQLVELVKGEAQLDLYLGDRTTKAEDRHPARLNPTQYDETTMDFLGRLMAEEGIFYFIRDDYRPLEDGGVDGHQVLVLGDSKENYDELKKSSDGLPLSLPYQPNLSEANSVGRWERQYQYRPAKWQIQDYNYRNSRDFNMTVPASSADSLAGAAPFIKFQRAAGFYNSEQGDRRLGTFDDREAVHREYVVAESLCQRLYPGAKIRLAKHPAESENGAYVVTAVEHRAIEFGAVQGQVGEYQNTFVCVPADRTVVECPRSSDQRPQRSVLYSAGHEPKTPPAAAARFSAGSAPLQLPVPAGRSIAELARVVDSQGAVTAEGQVDVFKDNLGIDHIYVRYPWDTEEGWTAENRRVRVMQPWSGAGWGAKYLPRIGQEVVVLFINGDPDNQDNVVVGTLTNDVNNFPVSSPQMQTVKLKQQDRSFDNRTGYAKPTLGNAAFPHWLGDTETTAPVDVPSLHDNLVSGIRSRSYDPAEQHAPRNNELLFDDTWDKEQLFVHASRDMNILVENDLNIEVRGDKKEVIRGNHYQVVCVGNIGPETGLSPTPTTRDGQPVQEHPYPPSADDPPADKGSFGVFRGITDGVSFDVDKTIGRKSVEFVRKDGGDYVWRQKVETYIDQETRQKGDTITVSIGDSESYRWEGNDFAFFGGAQESVFLGAQLSEFAGGQQSLFLGAKLEFGFSLDVGYSFSLKLRGEDSLGINNRVFTVDQDKVKLEKIEAAIKRHMFRLDKGENRLNEYSIQIEQLKTQLRTAEADIRKAKLELSTANVRITKAEIDLMFVDAIVFT